MTLDQYIANINQRFKLGNATEHTFRGDLQQLIETLVPEIRATNEPKRQTCGAPDYILTKGEIPVGFIEAKDLGDKDLTGSKKTGNKEQFDRYKASLNNIFFTDYLDFYLYREGEFVTQVAIGKIENGTVIPLTENFASFTNLLKDFCIHIGQNIKSSKKLAEMMAGKARLLAEIIEKALTSDADNQEDSTLKDQMNAFKDILIHDITPKGFADVYAQTIAYGMFAARLHDPTLPTFSRQEAAELIPKSNPFLRKLFGYIAGPDIDDRIKWIVDSLVEVFLACNVAEILKNYGKTTGMEDPIIHFYENFLSEYDPALRKARGVWYTPQPVVNFIVRAVDDILKTEFDLPQGLSDTSKTKIKVNVQGSNKPVEQEVHRVQILDPATGTGTFLAEVVKHVHKKFVGQQGIWSNYVETHLLPRLNGFELLMASYAMAHLKLDLLLTDTGYKPTKEQRLRVYLTNSLEEHHPDTGTLFANWLSSEANEANHIKRDTPVMCVIGNPPYSVSSSNKSHWIESLTADYKKDLNERNIQPLSDDYIKFIRFGQHFVDKNGSGVVAYISNNSFLDGVIHRQMRKHLLESFDKIYILNLHGNSRLKETSPDGSVDQNVFDIMAGVSINIFVKNGKKKIGELGEILNFDLYGKREFKYDYLDSNSLKTINWKNLNSIIPSLYFVEKNFEGDEKYNKGFKIDTILTKSNSGIKSHRDNLVYDIDYNKLIEKILKFKDSNIDDATISSQLNIKSNRDWDLHSKRELIIKNSNSIEKLIRKVEYKPFDKYFCYYDENALDYHRIDLMKNMFNDNLLLISSRKDNSSNFKNIFITNLLGDIHSLSDQSYCFPLYLYPETSGQLAIGENTTERKPNLNQDIVDKIADGLGARFVAEKDLTGFKNLSGLTDENTFAPIDILDYIYAVLHSPTYREKYKEFLKIDFPRVPYPKDAATFWQLVKLGAEIRKIHLLESEVVENYITQYPEDGDNVVVKPRFETYKVSENLIGLSLGKVYINETQYFDNVPEVAWNFYIGGYQPAQKWLKDRKERTLDFEDILHYQKIIVSLTETDRLMKEIDKIEIE